MHIFRSISEPIRSGLDWDTLWKSKDLGLVACWERGREKALTDTVLAAKVTAGQLPVLPWKGGFKEATKLGWRYGTFNYLAMWQGMKGEDLNIHTDLDVTMVCAATGMKTVFTSDRLKFAPAGEDEQQEE